MSRWRHVNVSYDAGEVKGSLPQCIERLCAAYLKKNVSRETTYSKPKVSLQEHLKSVKKAAFDALFDRQQKNPEVFPAELLLSGNWNEENIVSAVAFRMRTTQRRFFDADRLEELAQKLLSDNAEYSRVLRFLLHLSNVDNYSPKQCDLSRRRKAPTRDEIRKIAKIKGSLYAGDYPYHFFSSTYTLFLPWHCSRIDIDQPIMYPERPKDTEQDLLHAKRYSSPEMSVKNYKGLFGLQSEIFADKGLTDSPYEIDSQTRLYGGLKHSRTFDLDIKLSYPAMTGPVDMMSSIASSITSVDEGFVSPSSSIDFSESETELPSRRLEQRQCTSLLPYYDYRNPEHDLNLWRECLTIKRSFHRTWETLGLPAGSTERQLYLTEAGSKVFDEVWQHRSKILHKLTDFLHVGRLPAVRWAEVAQDKLVKHTVLVAMGVASETFQLNGLAQMFIPRKDIYFSGVDPESVHSLLSRFGEWGTCYWRLVHFSTAMPQRFSTPVRFFHLRAEQDTESGDIEKKGAIFKAFAGAIRRYLHEYQHRILSMNIENLTVQNLALKLSKVGSQIRYLCKLCQCGEPELPPPSPDAAKSFPTGIALLSYLYEEAIHCPDPAHNLVLLYLLRKSCLPYLQFVQDWVFRGNCWDARGEFMLRVNADFGGPRRDRQRWLKYVEPVRPTDPGSCVPSFLSSVAVDIYTCGKTVSLMQFICPEHFLVVDGIDTPELEISFSKRKLQRIENSWKRHDLKMVHYESERTTHWIQKEKEIKAAAHEVVRLVRKAARKETAKIQEALKQEKIERAKQKRSELEQLKKQAEEEAERKAMAIRKEKEEDAKRVKDRLRKELAKEEEKNRIVRQEKEKIISYYEELNINAEKRILKADWIKRRNQLQLQRMNFNAEDEKSWWRELEKQPVSLQELATGDNSESDVSSTARSKMEVRDAENVSELSAQSTSLVPDILQEFVDNVASAQPRPKDPVIPSGTSAPDMQKEFCAIEAGEFFFKSAMGSENSHPVPRIHHVSHESLNHQKFESKTQRKTITGKNVTDSSISLGQDLSTPVQKPAGFEIRASRPSGSDVFFIESSPVPQALRSSVATVARKNVSNSSIGNLVGLDGSPQTASQNEKCLGRKPVVGYHVSATTFAKPLMTGHDPDDCTIPKTFKKLVPGQSVSTCSVAALVSPADTRAPVASSDVDEDVGPKTFKKLVPGQNVSLSTVSSLMTGDDLEDVTTKTFKKLVPGQGVSASTVAALMSPAEVGALTTGDGQEEEVAPKTFKKLVPGQSVSRSTISELLSPSEVGALIPGNNLGEDVPSRTFKKLVPGRNVSTSTVAAIMTGSDPEEDIAFKTFKKLVPGQNVSATTVAELISPAEVGASPTFTPKFFEPDSVMGEILYGSPVSQPYAGCQKPLPTQYVGLTETRTMVDNELSHPSDSTIQAFLYGGIKEGVIPAKKRTLQRRMASESCIENLKALHGSVGEDPLPNKDIDKLKMYAMANSAHSGHHSQSSVQSLLYYDNSSPWAFEKSTKSRFEVLKSAILKPSINSAKRHPSYSTLQLLLYPKPVMKERDTREPPRPMEETFHLQLPALSGYSDLVQSKLKVATSNEDGRDVAVDLIGKVKGKSMEDEFEDESSSHDWRSDIDTVDMHVLPILLSQCIVRPIMQQVALVNRCIINYFMVDMELLRHFEMLRHFCFMEDGEFGQIMSAQLFEKMHSGCRPIDLLNPVALRSLITQAVQGSAIRHSPHSSKLTFSIQQLPHAFSTTDPSSLDCFTLKYDIGWPCNIIITETNQLKYGQVFGFLLKLKRIMWALHDVVSKLSSMEMSSYLSKSELRRLHLYRHEMQNFIKVMQGYVSTQVVHVCWHEFQDGLKSAKCLEDLHASHNEYLRKCIYRCLLTKKSSAVMNMITDIFKIILRFWTQLSSSSVSFAELRVTYANFRKYSDFLFKVVSKLVDHGYQPHLEDFLLRLNYNGFYDKCLSRDVRK